MGKSHPSERSLANLRPFNRMSEAERKAMNSRGGKKGNETKKERKKCAELLEIILNKGFKDKNGNQKDGRELLMVSLVNQAIKNGKIDATKLILLLLGEMPKPEFSISTSEKDDGILDGLLKANLEIQKKVLGEKGNGQTGTESSDADC